MSELSVEEEIVQLFEGTLSAPADAADTETTEPETAETVEAPVETVEGEQVEPEPLLAGKYKNVDELERAYEAAQQMLGRQGNELGQLRDEFTQLREQITTPAPQTYDPVQVDDFLAENPHQIPQLAEQAIQTGDQVMYNRAINAWRELDPMGATDFHTRKLIEAERLQMQQQLAPVQAQQEAVQNAQQFQAAYESKIASNPDFSDVLSNITEQQLNSVSKTILSVIQTGDPQAKVDALETLYWKMKSEQAGNLSATVADVTAQAQQAAQQARQDAVVASTTASSDRTERVLSPTEKFYEAFENSAAFKKYTAPPAVTAS